jgi:hypothetical protein
MRRKEVLPLNAGATGIVHMFHHTHGKDWYHQSDVPVDPRRAGTGQSQDNISVRVCCSIAMLQVPVLARNWSCRIS